MNAYERLQAEFRAERERERAAVMANLEKHAKRVNAQRRKSAQRQAKTWGERTAKREVVYAMNAVRRRKEMKAIRHEQARHVITNNKGIYSRRHVQPALTF